MRSNFLTLCINYSRSILEQNFVFCNVWMISARFYAFVPTNHALCESQIDGATLSFRQRGGIQVWSGGGFQNALDITNNQLMGLYEFTSVRSLSALEGSNKDKYGFSPEEFGWKQIVSKPRYVQSRFQLLEFMLQSEIWYETVAVFVPFLMRPDVNSKVMLGRSQFFSSEFIVANNVKHKYHVKVNNLMY